jgi:hypothetical protein
MFCLPGCAANPLWSSPVPDVPTADVTVRLGYWRQMYDRARALKLIDRAMELLEHMRNEDAQRRLAA